MSFDFKKYLINLKGKEYLPIAARLIWFRQEHPDWSIITTPIEINLEKNFAIFSASIMNAEGKIINTGTKMETSKDFGDFLEKAETGSVGRALAMCGFGTQFCEPDFNEAERFADAPVTRPMNNTRPAHVPPAGGKYTQNTPVPKDTPDAFNPNEKGCAECGALLTPGQVTLSQRKFGRLLCPTHQQGQQPVTPATNQGDFLDA